MPSLLTLDGVVIPVGPIGPYQSNKADTTDTYAEYDLGADWPLGARLVIYMECFIGGNTWVPVASVDMDGKGPGALDSKGLPVRYAGGFTLPYVGQNNRRFRITGEMTGAAVTVNGGYLRTR